MDGWMDGWISGYIRLCFLQSNSNPAHLRRSISVSMCRRNKIGLPRRLASGGHCEGESSPNALFSRDALFLQCLHPFTVNTISKIQNGKGPSRPSDSPIEKYKSARPDRKWDFYQYRNWISLLFFLLSQIFPQVNCFVVFCFVLFCGGVFGPSERFQVYERAFKSRRPRP